MYENARGEKCAGDRQPPDREAGAASDEEAEDDQNEKHDQACVGYSAVAARPFLERAKPFFEPALINGSNVFVVRRRRLPYLSETALPSRPACLG